MRSAERREDAVGSTQDETIDVHAASGTTPDYGEWLAPTLSSRAKTRAQLAV
jgi:hypothetical protein